MNQQRYAQFLQRPCCPVEKLLIDRPVLGGQIAQCTEYPGHCSRPAFEDPAKHDLLPNPGGRFGEYIRKLKNNIVPCRYKRYSFHAGLPIHCVCLYNTYIGLSASFLSILYLQILAKVHYEWKAQRKIPFVKVGGFLRFRRTDLEKWLEKRTQQEKDFDILDDE